MFSKDIYAQRRDTLRKKVGGGIIIMPGNAELPFNYPGNTFPFRQDSVFLYYIGIDEPALFAVIDCDGGDDVLFGNDISIDDIIWTGKVPSVADKAIQSGIVRSMPLSQLQEYISTSAKGRRIHYIAPYQAEIRLMLADIMGIPVSELQAGQSVELIRAVVDMRKTKSALELEEIEKSVNVTAEMHCRAMRLIGKSIQGGFAMTERDVVGELYRIAVQRGYYNSFPPIVTIHGEVFHNHGYSEQLRKGALLLVDAGAECDSHYAGDMTRTIPVSGKFSKRQKDIYDIVVKANMGVLQSAKPGILWRDMHNRAARIIASGLKDLGLMKGDTDDIVSTGAYALFFPHGLGHLLGLDVHDMEALGEEYVGYSDQITRSETFGPSCLRYALPLEKDMVITDEPGIYFIPELIDLWRKEGKFADFINYDRVEKYKGFGGIRIEDDLHITDSGCRVMGVPVPKESQDVEDLVARWSN